MQATEGWYTYEIEMPAARRTNSTRTILVAYECPLESCSGNNTCKGGRTGLLCGYCPADMALELNVCVPCESDATATSIAQAVLGILALAVLFLVLFLLGWRTVYPENVVHKSFDKLLHNMYSTLENMTSCIGKKGRNVKFDPADARRAVQGAKIFFSFYQVVTGFISFKVPLPDLLASTILYLFMIGKIFTLDIFELPGMGCLVGMAWSQRLVVRTLMPLAIMILMTVPVGVAQLHLRSIETQGSTEANEATVSDESRRELQRKRLKAKENLEQASNSFWSHCLSWLFLVFPSMTLASMEAFSCQRIGNELYLSADLVEHCPTSSDGVYWFSVFMTAVWVVGTPIFVLWSLIYHDVPGLVGRKTMQAVLSQMIDRYVADSVDPSRRKLANSIGKRVTELGDCSGDQEFERRSADLYQTIFPDHAECGGGVFPKLCAVILKKVLSFRGASGLAWVNISPSQPAEGRVLDNSMLSEALAQKFTFTEREWIAFWIKDLRMNHVVKSDDSFFKPAGPASGAKLTLPDFKNAIAKWFEDVDIDLNDSLDQQELRREFEQLGLEDAEVDSILMHFAFARNGQLDKDEFEVVILHILDSGIPGLRYVDALALFMSLPEVAANIPISLERFQQYSKGLCLEALVFTGAERADSLTGQQLLALLDHNWKRYNLEMDDEIDMKVEADFNILADKTGEALKAVEAALFKADRREPTEEEKNMLRQCKDICKELNISADSVDIQKATVWDLPAIYDVMIGALNPLLPASFIDANANTDASHIFSMRHTVIKLKTKFEGALLKDLQKLGLTLLDEGVLTNPALEWDGALGTDEVAVIERLGFLLDAYQATCWYWEVVEMMRKLILTSLLVVIYNGSAPHLVGSLITTFLFIIAHLRVHPYLNRRLNNFQRLALISQFFTILGCIIYLMVDTLNELHEVKPSNGDEVASTLLAWFILAINWLTGFFYPMYRILLLAFNSNSSLSDKIRKHFNRLLRMTHASDEGGRNIPPPLVTDQQKSSARQLLLQQRDNQDFGDNTTEDPGLRKRVRAAAAVLPAEVTDEIRAVQHQSTQGGAIAVTAEVGHADPGPLQLPDVLSQDSAGTSAAAAVLPEEVQDDIQAVQRIHASTC